MPYYDYKCGHCQNIFEAEHGMGERAPLACPNCHSPDIRRVYAPIGFTITSGLSNPVEVKSSSRGQTSCASCASGVCSTCGSKG